MLKKQQRVNGLVIRQTKHCQKKLLNADYTARVETGESIVVAICIFKQPKYGEKAVEHVGNQSSTQT